MKEVTLYTDGACSGNPGPGGYGCILIYNGVKKELSGGAKDTTNNRMELLAIIQGLKALKEPCRVLVHSDSALCVDAFNSGWIENWQKNGWKTKGKDDVKNKDLWNALLLLMRQHDVSFVKVKGHADDELNNRCDELARSEIGKLI